MRGILLIGLISFGFAATAATAAPEALSPAGPWEINYDADSCHLLRSFGQGERTVILRLSRFQPAQDFQISLFGKRFSSNKPRFLVRSNFSSDASVLEHNAMIGKAGDLPVVMLGGSNLTDWRPSPEKPDLAMPILTLEQEKAITSFSFKQYGANEIRLETGQMGAPMKALRGCGQDLVRSWGFDPDAQATRSSPPLPFNDPNKWLREEDFPMIPAFLGHNAQVNFRLDVEADGSVSKCHIQEQTEPPEFAALTCSKFSQRARFKPALDSAGKPIRSYFVSTVRWLTAASY